MWLTAQDGRSVCGLLYLTAVRLSAWELDCHVLLTGPLQVSPHHGLSVSGRRVPVLTPMSGTRRARQCSPPGDPGVDRTLQAGLYYICYASCMTEQPIPTDLHAEAFFTADHAAVESG